MIDFATTKVGDKLRVVGQGAPGFAKLGDIVTVTLCNGHNRCDVAREDGETAYFALTCGAARLEPMPQRGITNQPQHCAGHKRFEYDCMDCVDLIPKGGNV